jgi:hypothetical protein
MSFIFSQLEATADKFSSILSAYQAYDEGHAFPWRNELYKSLTFRRAHLDVVDARQTKGLFMMHLCIFPHVSDPSPIFGFDLIAGPKKVTGAFHDFSPVRGDTGLDLWFADAAAQAAPSRQRALPDWASRIFSKHMVAAGNVSEPEELERVLDLGVNNLLHYLDNVGRKGSEGSDFTERQNAYCRNQKQNPHTPKVMGALGFDESVVASFIETCLFPEIKTKSPFFSLESTLAGMAAAY